MQGFNISGAGDLMTFEREQPDVVLPNGRSFVETVSLDGCRYTYREIPPESDWSHLAKFMEQKLRQMRELHASE